MPQRQRKLIYSLLNLPTGSLAITDVRLTRWGSDIVISCIYRYPPEEKTFRIVFKDCRGIEWNVIKDRIAEGDEAQMLTHDLGEGKHQHTARIATTLVELIITYGELSIEKDW
jgi:hypothetical protein